MGPGADPNTDVGPLVNTETVDNLDQLVRSATGAGADIVIGGRRPDRAGFFYEPTVLVNVAPDSPILRDEIFGPVAPIVTFDSEDEAVEQANDTEYGLVAYVYTGDLARGLRVGSRLESGMIGLNRGLVSDPAAPFGGVKQSGIGREGSHHGLAEYLETKYISTSWGY